MLERAAVFFVIVWTGAHAGNAQTPDPEIERGRVAIYLDDGRRLESAVPDRIRLSAVLRNGGLASDRVVAVAAVPRDRLLDGVLVGMGAGAAISQGFGAAVDDSDLSAGLRAVGAAYGLAIGAGLGAMLDAGIAKPEKLVYARSAGLSTASGSRRWNLALPPGGLAGWLRGRKVDLMLRDGTALSGKVVGGDERSVELSRRGRSTSIESAAVSTVIYRENVGGNRFAAALGGGLTGVVNGVMLGGLTDDDDAAGIVVGGAVGTLVGTAVGFGLAQHENWREVTLTIRP